MIYRIDYMQFFRTNLNFKYNFPIPLVYKAIFYSANSEKEAEQLFWQDHPHEELEIRQTHCLDESKPGKVFGPVEI